MFRKKEMTHAAMLAIGLSLACAANSYADEPALPTVTQMAVADFNSCTKPQYPHDDFAAGHKGTVTLAFLVGADGTVSDSKVVKSSGFMPLDEAARTAILKCHFSPALAGAKPVAHWTRVQYVWSLN
jgi:TonB family protein